MLTAIAIPIFTTQLEKSREATDLANVRSAYAEVVADYLGSTSTYKASVSATQTQPNWVDGNTSAYIGTDINGQGRIPVPAVTAPGSYTIEIDNSGSVKVS